MSVLKPAPTVVPGSPLYAFTRADLLAALDRHTAALHEPLATQVRECVIGFLDGDASRHHRLTWTPAPIPLLNPRDPGVTG